MLTNDPTKLCFCMLWQTIMESCAIRYARRKETSIIHLLDQSFWTFNGVAFKHDPLQPHPGGFAVFGWLEKVPNIVILLVRWIYDKQIISNKSKTIETMNSRFFLHGISTKIEISNSILHPLDTWTSTNKALVQNGWNEINSLWQNPIKHWYGRTHPRKLRNLLGSHCEIVPLSAPHHPKGKNGVQHVKAHCDASEMHDFDFGWPQPAFRLGRVGTSIWC